ncbi:MAG: hypothetical protein HY909_15880 [Deltaproteobacteria bacterium]|nr:hypothetical protein [Deltaproteobacteria bacterium]
MTLEGIEREADRLRARFEEADRVAAPLFAKQLADVDREPASGPEVDMTFSGRSLLLPLSMWTMAPIDTPYDTMKAMVQQAGWSTQPVAGGAGPDAEHGFEVTSEAGVVWTFSDEDGEIHIWVSIDGEGVTTVEAWLDLPDEGVSLPQPKPGVFRLDSETIRHAATSGGRLRLESHR